ncbi:hypothetical protein HK097_000767 [Rhizophlyctis rosea]|uniref:Ankyrin repeat domain-containing protein n=1 Tax=Rhizophlyctis rosea TaxID=64517 RepID=A0AAD5S833_9FUNG|nr:hypothetical protein HK097_000767 [Rhizophlyctis rosea]
MAVKAGEIDIAKLALQSGANPHFRFDEPFADAVASGHLDIADVIAEACGGGNGLDWPKLIQLQMLAAVKNSLPAIEYLVNLGPSDQWMTKTIKIAACVGNKAVFKQLMNNVKIWPSKQSLTSAVTNAAGSGDVEMVEALLRFGEGDFPQTWITRAMAAAVKGGHLGITEMLWKGARAAGFNDNGFEDGPIPGQFVEHDNAAYYNGHYQASKPWEQKGRK